ncbi:MAG: hypothetical protein BroJett011_51190 [Chloroflexota bacterium]|nr:MAG: hypothetical protein BroJett011_51190 [Chloroflexota bacterium]
MISDLQIYLGELIKKVIEVWIGKFIYISDFAIIYIMVLIIILRRMIRNIYLKLRSLQNSRNNY